MKKIFSVFVAVLFFTAIVTAQQVAAAHQKFIEITGYATTTVEPDNIYYTISLPNTKINTEDEKEIVKEDSIDVTVEKKIKEDNNLKWIKIREILGRQNLKEEEDPDTKTYTIGNRYNLYGGNLEDEVTVKVPSLIKLENLVTQLKTIKGCKGSIGKSNNSRAAALKEETLMKALANAKDKATKIAAKMNVKLGSVIQITEQGALNSLVGSVMNSFGEASSGHPSLSGLGLPSQGKNGSNKISVSESIVVKFEIQD